MTDGLAGACADLAVAWPEAAALIAELDRTGMGVFTLPSKTSRPPWNAQAANAVLDAHAGVRELEAEMRDEVTRQQPWRGRGGSDGNTMAAIQAIGDLAALVARTTAGDAEHRVRRYRAVINQLPARDTDERWLKVHGAACLHCGNTMLRLGERSKRVTCVRWSACYDHDGVHPVGFVTTSVDQHAMVAWADGCNQYADVQPQ